MAASATAASLPGNVRMKDGCLEGRSAPKMHRPRARGEWRRLAPVADDGEDGEHLEGDDGPGNEANPPRHHQPGAAERTPVQVLAHLDAATATLSRHGHLRTRAVWAPVERARGR